MSILPTSAAAADYAAQITEYPSDTWIIADNTIIGMGTGREAMHQAVDAVLNVERFRYQIYTPNFGAELNNLIGKEPEYVESMLKRRISDALLVDKRILSVHDFSCEQTGIGIIACSFHVRTVFGTLRKEVELSD